jgi:lipoprotein-anchoring transpeptidase ErfK/SrfK
MARRQGRFPIGIVVGAMLAVSGLAVSGGWSVQAAPVLGGQVLNVESDSEAGPAPVGSADRIIAETADLVPVLRIGRYRNPRGIEAGWRTLLERHGDLLAGLAPVTVTEPESELKAEPEPKAEPAAAGRSGGHGAGITLLALSGASAPELQRLCRQLFARGRTCAVLQVPAAALRPLGAASADADPGFAPPVPLGAMPAAPPESSPVTAPESSSVRAAMSPPVQVALIGRARPTRGLLGEWRELRGRFAAQLGALTPVAVATGRSGQARPGWATLGLRGSDPTTLFRLCDDIAVSGRSCWLIDVAEDQLSPLPPEPRPLPMVAVAAPKPEPVKPAQDRGRLRLDAPTPQRTVTPIEPNEIVISIADRRLFYAAADGRLLAFPVGVARNRRALILGETQVVGKREHPTWHPTANMRQHDPTLPTMVGPGPHNPMGGYAIYLGWPNIRIHGTNRPGSVGGAVSHGCYRMRADDIKTLFHLVDVGTRVKVLDAPVTPEVAAPSASQVATPAPSQPPNSAPSSAPVGGTTVATMVAPTAALPSSIP